MVFNLTALTTNTHTAAHFNFDNNITPTDITVSHVHSTFSDQREVNVNDYNTQDPSYYGRWYCRSWNGNVCTNGNVEINEYYSYTLDMEKSLVCEEVGHSVGLAHQANPSSSCMSQDWEDWLLTTHDKTILNGRY